MKTGTLMKDSSNGDCNKETMLDFVLSWTLRRASSDYINEDPLLYKYCRRILFALLEIDKYENIEVSSVETWKQWNHIDLHANIGLKVDGEIQWHAILIENKVYTPTHSDQLKRYRQIFDDTYGDGAFKDHLHYVLITCHETPTDELKADCKKNGYRCLPILDLQPNCGFEDTKSDIFNEFWLREW